MLLCIVGEFLYQALTFQEGQQLLGGSERLHLLAVVVGIVESKLQDQSTHGGLFIIRGDADSVLRHEDVGGDSAAAIDGAPDAGVISRTGVLDAVL